MLELDFSESRPTSGIVADSCSSSPKKKESRITRLLQNAAGNF